MKRFILHVLFFFFGLALLQAQPAKPVQRTKTAVVKSTVKTSVAPTVIATTTIETGAPINAGAYENYDFVPGTDVVFADDFSADAAGTSPSHWTNGSGKAMIQTFGGQKALCLTEGNYAHVAPLVKNTAYLGDAFTIEFDVYTTGGYGPHFYFYNNAANAANASEDMAQVDIDKGNIWTTVGVTSKPTNLDVQNEYPPAIKGEESFHNKWHHVAISFKAKTLRVYMDQYLLIAVPDWGYTPAAFDVEGIGDAKQPVILTNVRVAKGGGVAMTSNKIVTHGINFDVNKAIIKPESMGTLNSIVKILKDDPTLKFEVGGHTDSDGDDFFNLKLSQARADAVRTQLIAMGIDSSRLTAKGYGEGRPISDNKTPEGKANNRRVEFVKQ